MIQFWIICSFALTLCTFVVIKSSGSGYGCLSSWAQDLLAETNAKIHIQKHLPFVAIAGQLVRGARTAQVTYTKCRLNQNGGVEILCTFPDVPGAYNVYSDSVQAIYTAFQLQWSHIPDVADHLERAETIPSTLAFESFCIQKRHSSILASSAYSCSDVQRQWLTGNTSRNTGCYRSAW